MFQRFRSLATSALLVGFATSIACSADEGDNDSGFDGDSGSSNASTNASTNGTTGNGGGSNGNSGSSGSGATSSTSTINTASATSSGNNNNNSSSSGSGGGIGVPLGEACEGIPFEGGGFEDEACVGTGYEAEGFPVDLVLYVDVSTSMVDNESNGVTRWELVRDAVADFVNDPEAADIGMGIRFWSWLSDSSCTEDYATPEVPIGPISDVQGDILDALDSQSPGGLTPTYPALEGAIEYAKSYASDHPARQAVVVFVTDGYPTRCDPQDIPSIAQLAEDSWASDPKVPVFTVGIDGVYNLDQIAQAGGTREAFLVENDGSTDRLVQALKNITTDTARCEFEIPPSPNPDFLSPDTEAVQVLYTPASGDVQEIPRVTGYSACSTAPNGGWFLGGSDANGKPTKIIVCPCSCANFAAGKVEVTLGCKATPSVQ